MKFLQDVKKLIPRGSLIETPSYEEHDKLVSRFAKGFSLNQIASMLTVKRATSDERAKIFNEILSNKEAVIKRALYYLKEDDLYALSYLIFCARKYGYDYPEFKIIEKSAPYVKELYSEFNLKEWGGGGKSADRGSDRGYRDDDEMQFITRKKGKKIQKNIIVKEEKLTFIAHDILRSNGGFSVRVIGIDPGPGPGPGPGNNYHATNVIFKPNGDIDGVAAAAAAHDVAANTRDRALWCDKHKKDIIHAALKYLHIGDKEIFLKNILKDYKNGHKDVARVLINLSRKRGFDYPEFKAIEKSMGKSLSESEHPMIWIGTPTLSAVITDTEIDDDGKEMDFYFKIDEGRDTIIIHFNSQGYFVGPFLHDKNFLEKNRGQIIKYIFDYLGMKYVSNHEKFIKQLLIHVKRGVPPKLIAKLISRARDKGFDYPEFKAIEKSIGKSLTEAVNNRKFHVVHVDCNDDNTIYIELMNTYGDVANVYIDSHGAFDIHGVDEGYQKKEIIDVVKSYFNFSDKHRFIKDVLQYIRNGDTEMSLALINFSRNQGFDYPEFKTIEKSAKPVNEIADHPHFFVGGIPWADSHCVMVRVKNANHVDPRYDGIRVEFTTYKSIHGKARITDDQAVKEWENHKKEIIDVAEKFIDDYFSNKDKFIKDMLVNLKSGYDGVMFPAVNETYIKVARNRGFDYPEFDAIEKSMGKKVTEAKATYSISTALNPEHDGVYIDDARNLHILVMRDGHRHHEHNGIQVVFKSNGRIAGLTYDEEGHDQWYNDKKEIITVAKGFFEKDSFIKLLLIMLKGDYPQTVRELIKIAKVHGYDYPEFAAIEKSLSASLKEAATKKPSFEVVDIDIQDSEIHFLIEDLDHSASISLWLDSYGFGGQGNNELGEIQWTYHSKEIQKVALNYIDFPNHDKFIKLLLTCLKKAEPHIVKFLIRMARARGFNYPEFKAIEKSNDSYLDEN